MHFLPSRQRPSSLKRFFQAYKETEADSEGVVWLDEDDAHNYELELPPKWVVLTAPRQDGTGPITNQFFEMFPDEPWYMLLGDDVLPRTKHWDKQLIEAAGTDGLSYCDDMLNGSSHAAHPCVGGGTPRRLGWLALPGCKRTYIDNALMEDAKHRGKITYLPNVVLEHLHFSNGKSPMDATYLKPHSNDKEIFDTWLASL